MAFDKEKVYDEQIAPLMAKIIAVATEHQIPMAATFQYADSEDEGPGYCVTVIHFPHQGEKMNRVAAACRPDIHVALAETITTTPDGRQSISIRRIT